MAAPDPRLEQLDGVARALGEVAGFDAGMRLVVHFGGQRVYVPEKMRPRSRFWEVLGPNAAQELAKLRGGEHIDVPTGSGANDAQRRRQIEAYLRAQSSPRAVSKDEVAATFKVNRRTVQRVRVALEKPTAPSPQIDLFEKRSDRV